ncbi:hypothetical protein K788_0007256 [Paraburkholderia caribensis MBA4]|uniref:DUF1330 domain-containing protein n=2 Tax=Paraburkholderia caribensis TaxID=75105 RepID=A0A0P0RKR9_9BURK|nr:hypothetical protein K788_0007256 [Paraburkholderia caribensis MBA4]
MKGYWLILGSDVKDAVAQDQYAALWKPIASRFQAKVRVLDASVVLREAHTTRRVVVVEFPSVALARACYDDAAYQDAIQFALVASHRELLIIEGDLA